jgi:hypothetical protein
MSPTVEHGPIEPVIVAQPAVYEPTPKDVTCPPLTWIVTVPPAEIVPV